MNDDAQIRPKKQRRGRKTHIKPLTDQAWRSLFLYWARTERLHDITVQLIVLLTRKYGRDFITARPRDLTLSDMEMFFEYWHSSLETVVEAYEKNGLSDDAVNELLDVPIREKLKTFRNNSFHFRQDFYDPNALSLFSTEGAPEWVDKLQLAMHNYLNGEARKLEQRLDMKPRTFEDLVKEAQSVPHRTLETLCGASKIPRNISCPCGSGLRYKRCHGRVEDPPET